MLVEDLKKQSDAGNLVYCNTEFHGNILVEVPSLTRKGPFFLTRSFTMVSHWKSSRSTLTLRTATSVLTVYADDTALHRVSIRGE